MFLGVFKPCCVCACRVLVLTAEMPASAGSKNKCVANSSPATHQTLGQQGGTGEDSYTHLADWTFSVAAIEKKKKTEFYVSLGVFLLTADNAQSH